VIFYSLFPDSQYDDFVSFEKAGIDPTVDNDETTDRKFRAWNRREQLRELRWQWFFYGAVVGGAIVYWWLR